MAPGGGGGGNDDIYNELIKNNPKKNANEYKNDKQLTWFDDIETNQTFVDLF